MKWLAGSLLGSVHAYFLFLLASVLLLLGAVSGTLLSIREGRNQGEVTVYEASRTLQGQSLAHGIASLRITREAAPDGGSSRPERLAGAALAGRLGLPEADVKVALAAQDRAEGSQAAAELLSYGNHADPVLHPPFMLAVRRGDGWLVVRGSAFPSFGRVGLVTFCAALTAILALVSLQFSRRLVQPLRDFAAAAERLRADSAAAPVPVAGPTELRAASEAVNRMQKRISEYVRERTAIIGAIAHDLRAPLARMRFHVESAPIELRAAIEREVAEMEQLAGVTLDFVEADTVGGAPEPVDLALLVEGVADDFADAGKSARLIESVPVTILGNALLLRRMFTNLIDNAVKYGGEARIAVGMEDGMAVIDVSDSGPGLSSEDIERAFEPFYRSEQSRSRATGGVGLGLAIASNAARAHGGTIRLENQEGGGLRARVTLPALV